MIDLSDAEWDLRCEVNRLERKQRRVAVAFPIASLFCLVLGLVLGSALV